MLDVLGTDDNNNAVAHLKLGKPWGTIGYGSTNGVTDTASADYPQKGSVAAMGGITYMKTKKFWSDASAISSASNNCIEHYMLIQIGVNDYGATV